jgi:hypothetical protein
MSCQMHAGCPAVILHNPYLRKHADTPLAVVHAAAAAVCHPASTNSCSTLRMTPNRTMDAGP